MIMGKVGQKKQCYSLIINSPKHKARNMNYKDLAAGLITTHRVKLDREGGGGSEEELACKGS